MKKLAAILFLLILGTSVLQAQSATFELPTIPNPGAAVIAPITITEANNLNNFYSMQAIIQFDPDVLEPIDVLFPNPNFPFYEWMCNIYYSPDEILLTWLSFSGAQTITPPEVLCEIEFEYNGGCSPLIWDSVYVSGINLTLIDGSIGCTTQNNLWEGTIDENWQNPDNWSFGTVPQGDDAEIPDIGSLYYPVIYGTGSTDSLFVHPNASLTIAPGGDLTTFGLFSNEGGFIIQSDENGLSGSYIDLSDVNGSGILTFNRNITNSSQLTNPCAWHFLASPIDGFTTDSLPDYHVNLWNENNALWVQIQGTEPCTPADPPVLLNQMEGWSIKLDPDYISNCGFGTGEIIEITGKTTDLHSGTYSVPFTYTPGNAYEGWNLIGNPYPCSIDPGLISWPDNLNQSIYLWDGRLNTYFTWAGGVGTESIPPTQGFFVNAFGDGTFTFSGDERIHHTENTWFKSEIENLLTLKASAIGNDYYDLTYIRFLEEATSDFDKEWDAYKLLSTTPEVPQIYTSTEDDILSINAKLTTVMVPLAFTSGQSGTFTIEAIETSNLVFIVLEDLFTGEQIDLLSDSYTFDFTAGDDPDRFVIYFTPVGTTENEENNVRIWSDDNNIIVRSETQSKGEIIIFDMLGKEIIRKPFKSNMNVIQVHQKNTLYIVEVLTTNNKTVKKVLVK
jgi:hypothetical protein